MAKLNKTESFAVWFLLAWCLAFGLAVCTAWAVGEERQEQRFVRCLEHRTAQVCYMIEEALAGEDQ